MIFSFIKTCTKINFCSTNACTDIGVHDFQIELIHDQLPLAVPCYDLLPVTDFTLVLLAKAFGYPRLPWVDGQWVQETRTYSLRYGWPAITSNSDFMRASCSPQSELTQRLRIGSGLLRRDPLSLRLYYVCSPGCQRDMLTWRHPRLPPPMRGSLVWHV